MPGLPLPILAGVFETIPIDRPELFAEVENPRQITALVVDEPTLSWGIVTLTPPTGATASDTTYRSAEVEPVLTRPRVPEPSSNAFVPEPVTGAVQLPSTGAIVIEPATHALADSVVTGVTVADVVPTGFVVPEIVRTGATESQSIPTGADVLDEETYAEML
jgi:hypothetical protein